MSSLLSFDECVTFMKGIGDASKDVSRLIWVDDSAIVTYRRYDTDDDIYITFYTRGEEADIEFVNTVNRLVVDDICDSPFDVFDEVCEDIGERGSHYEL